MDFFENKLFWFGLANLFNGITMTFNLIDYSKGTKLNFGEGQEIVGLSFIVVGLIALGYDYWNKKR